MGAMETFLDIDEQGGEGEGKGLLVEGSQGGGGGSNVTNPSPPPPHHDGQYIGPSFQPFYDESFIP